MIDVARILVRSGDGGDGLIHFRREKYVPRGGPAGGDGGHGGDVVLVVKPKVSTLSGFQHRQRFQATSGARGGPNNQTGASAAALELEVPAGTLVRDADSGAIIGDLLRPGDRLEVATGGRGGRGNTRFRSSSRQAPRIAEKGEPGRERQLLLELRLIADVGLVGVPNAGKSTLLSVLSKARPRIANYPFTTLEPNLGVLRRDDAEIVLADIPGLIEGAHQGVGLGHAFLRHVQRTRMLVHLLDGASPDPLADYNQINVELALFDERLAEKPQIVVFNKLDLPEAAQRWPSLEARLREEGVKPMAISALTRMQLRAFVSRLLQVHATLPETPPEAVDAGGLPQELPDFDPGFTIRRSVDGSFVVSGARIERAAAMTYWDHDEAVLRFQHILETLGVSGGLESAGVQAGDTVYIGDYELEWSE
ncbi:MAG: GTPase ObgE [Anaerolineaceae bacterium]|nr:GTPase ObgE [Anaerolineaceae bacterium]MDE0329400.1 GTPase ObgE [Anaerolineaceae bacterium]